MLGADLAYLGTRFIATRESTAPEGFKDMIVTTNAADIVYTAAISGVHGNFLKPSIDAAGVPADALNASKQLELSHEKRAWKNVWSAGQGVGSIDDVPTTAELCARLIQEYREAMAEAVSDVSKEAAAARIVSSRTAGEDARERAYGAAGMTSETRCKRPRNALR